MLALICNTSSIRYAQNDDRTAGGHKFSLCWGAREDVPDEMATIRKVMKHASLDKRRCPLTDRIHSLAKGIAKEERNIRARDKHVTLVICTQGMPTDSHGDKGAGVRRELQHELAKLSNLPVKVIVRLCTDDEGVRDMFNTMDSKFNSVDVLDDYWGEVCAMCCTGGSFFHCVHISLLCFLCSPCFFAASLVFLPGPFPA